MASSHEDVHAQEKEGKLSPLLARRRYRAVAENLGADDVVLDLGCGSGGFGAYLNDTQSNVYFGADTAKCWEGEPGNLFVVKVGDPLPSEIATAGVTVVTSLALIEHLENPVDLFHQARTMLPDGGRFILTTPHPIARHIHEIGGKLGLFSSHASDEHEDFLDEAKLRNLATEAGFATEKYSKFQLGMNQVAVFVKA